MRIIAAISQIIVIFYAASALVPILRSDAWWIRIFDFPRLQLLGLGLVFGAIYFFSTMDAQLITIGTLLLLLIGASFDLYRILPYSPIWSIESPQTQDKDPSRVIRLLTVNVLQQNQDTDKILKLIDEESPDIILLLETNERWVRKLAPLKTKYKFSLEQPLENEYGLVFYSRLPVESAEIRYLIETTIPSVRATVLLPSGDPVEIFGLHPRPPRYKDGPTTERDAELVQVAKAVKESSTPAIVMGDLNDVAWSHTTRLFRRISGLLDPRVGRTPFPTFPADLPFLRFPLDYIFHSEFFTLNSIERLGDVGSDHLPMQVTLTLSSKKPSQSEAPTPDDGDIEEANETLQRAKNNNE